MATHTPDQLTNIAAVKLIEDTGISILEAALLVRELYQGLGGRGKGIMRARLCIQLGKRNCINGKNRFLPSGGGGNPEGQTAPQTAHAGGNQLHLHTADEELPGAENQAFKSHVHAGMRRLHTAHFSTLRQQHKARVVLSGIFSTALKRGWCAENPALQIELPPLREQAIRPLVITEIRTLFHSARQLYGSACIPPLGLMLYAGIRPAEVERLTWDAVNMEERVVCLKALHSKTGGSRHVQIHPVLHRLLKEAQPSRKEDPVCPPNWAEKWRRVRQHAGWNAAHGLPWIQDVLRHTYASYHAKHFRNFTELQYEMGHSGLHLLKSRYLNMQDISRQDASRFWDVRESGLPRKAI